MIAPETIEQVRQATDIVDLLSQYVRLKRRGRRFIAVCPFHTEKTPSFSVSPEKQLYYCFGCQRGGTVFTFLQEHEGMSFTEAVHMLARRANIQIREDRGTDRKRELAERVAYANQVALEYFRKTLFNPRYESVLDDYLIKRRGITRDTAKEFQLGLAGQEWDGLIRYARPKGLTPEDLVECGLASQSQRKNKIYDRFRERLIIPIFNLSQKPIAFGGRTLKKGEQAKYINSPETALYSKSNVLYNLNLAKDAIRKAEDVFVVEGYFDVISLWQAGVQNVVASSGTAFTLQQARLLARFADEVYLFFDADSAGRNAALRSVDVLFDAGLEVKVISAPPGEDPDSLARTFGFDKIDELKHDAMGFIPFRVQDVDLRTTGIIAREKLVKELGGLAARISDPTRRSLFLDEAASTLGVDTELLTRAGQSERREPTDTGPNVAQPRKKHDSVQRHLVSILMQNPGIIDTIFEKVAPEDFTAIELRRLYSALSQQYRSAGKLNARALVDTAQDNEFTSLITELAALEWEDDKIDTEARRLLKDFLNDRKKRIRDELRKELAEAEASGDQEKATKLLEELNNYGLTD